MKMASMVAVAMMVLVAVGCGTEAADPKKVAEETTETAYLSTDCNVVLEQYNRSGNCHASNTNVCALGGIVLTCCGALGDGTSEFSFCTDGRNEYSSCRSTYHSDDCFDGCDC